MKRFIIPALLLTPMMAFAQFTNVSELLTAFGNLVNAALPIIVGLALLGLFWGLAVFIFAAGDAEKKDKGKHYMIWSIVALFVMVSVWGLVEWIGTALDVDQGGSVVLPEVPGLE